MNNREKFTLFGGIVGILSFILKLVESLNTNNQYIIASVFVLLCLIVAITAIWLISWHYKEIINELRSNNKTITESFDKINKLNRELIKEERENNDKLKKVSSRNVTESSDMSSLF